ncbi:MAG: glycosyltransferase [Verrucomicrobiota bacterium]|jgi:dolichol-phosphate mannosyltransferase|nr:glycosyltransferase [Verrucomicrobiota bacterium]
MKASRQLSELSLAIVCPMANEAERAVDFVDAVLKQCQSFRSKTFLVVLDRANRDNTLDLMREHAKTTPDLTVIWAPENRGPVDAYVRGYREALALNPDWILEIDAGFSHQPSDIPVLFEKMGDGYDCVFGSRFCPGGSIQDSSKKRYWISWGGTFLTNMLLGTKLQDMTSGFQLFTREALQMIVDRSIQSRGPFFQTEMKTYCRNLEVAEAPIHYRAASHNVGSKQIKDAFKNLWRLFGMRLAGRV